MSNPNGVQVVLSGLPGWLRASVLSVIIIGITIFANWRVAEWRLNDTVGAVQAEKARNDEQDRRFISREEQAQQTDSINKRLDDVLAEIRETRRRVDDLYKQGIRPR